MSLLARQVTQMKQMPWGRVIKPSPKLHLWTKYRSCHMKTTTTTKRTKKFNTDEAETVYLNLCTGGGAIGCVGGIFAALREPNESIPMRLALSGPFGAIGGIFGAIFVGLNPLVVAGSLLVGFLSI